MQFGRRLFLRAGIALAGVIALPRTMLAASWPENAFSSTAASGALNDLFGTEQTTLSDKVSLKVPEIAENGAVVPVRIVTTLENVESISIIVEKNPRPLAAMIEISPGTLPEFSSRIKMGQTSNVMAVVKTEGGIYAASKEVKVTIGGCGG